MLFQDNVNSKLKSPSLVINEKPIEILSDDEIQEFLKDDNNSGSVCELIDENNWSDCDDIDNVLAQVILFIDIFVIDIKPIFQGSFSGKQHNYVLYSP